MNGERSVRCATSCRPSRKKEVNKSLIGNDEFVRKAAVVLFTRGWGRVKIWQAPESSGDEVLPVKGRATTRFCLTTWVGQRLDEARCHWWLVTVGALGARQSARGTEGSSSGDHGMRPRHALTWRRQLCGGGAQLQCSAGRRTARCVKWPVRCSEARLGAAPKWRKGEWGSGAGVPMWRRGEIGGVQAWVARSQTAATASPTAAGAGGF
jgi:hypothetical protein